jgi:hypothetical protein
MLELALWSLVLGFSPGVIGLACMMVRALGDCLPVHERPGLTIHERFTCECPRGFEAKI